MQNSETLRARLSELETVVERSGGAVIAAQTAHSNAIRRAIETGDHDAPAQTEAVLTVARATHARTCELVEEARSLLAAAVRAEKQAAADAARGEIEAEITELEALAHEADADFAAMLAKLRQLHDRETALHSKARVHFRTPWTAPQARSAARPMATYLGTLANGVTPPTKPFVAATVASGAHAIRSAIHGE